MLKSVMGLQFGDEGKGKFVDFLSDEINHVARFNGGANAGHTVIHNGVKAAFSQLPAILREKNIYICQGALISPSTLYYEIERMNSMKLGSKLKIDPRCHVVLPIHAELNKASESFKKERRIGSVGKGVGACFEDKCNRHGIRMIDIIDEKIFKYKFDFLWALRDAQISNVFCGNNELSYSQVYDETLRYGEKLSRYFSFVNQDITDILNSGEDVLLETSQATFLDVSFGSYPYTVAYQTLVQNCFPMIGIPCTKMITTGVLKAYTIRVGNGPFPTELYGNEAKQLREKGNEFGTVSGRPRRCGWLDLNLVKHAIKLNGVNELAITNVDVLSGLNEIKISNRYKKDGEYICGDEALLDLSKVTPEYETFKSWDPIKHHVDCLEDFPKNLLIFLRFIESECGIPIKYVSYGPERKHTLMI